jgi:NAD(P)-dependent dehydrogenase (short-subunit alcohol dehydrogenase family)
MSTAHGGQGGCIVTIASGAARAPGGLPGIVPYAATKGALVTFARGLPNEVAAEGIRVNSVSPGVIDTNLAYPKAREAAAHSPLGRMGRPDEIAAAVSWLISPEVVEVSPGEYQRAREAALRELGLTYRELQAQARTGRFSSLRARKLWLAIGPHRTRSA